MSSDNLTSTENVAADSAVVAKLSTLDRYLPIWILVAMAVGLLGGRLVPGLGRALDAISVHGVSLPIALGLLIMMYPVLAKVRYDRLDTVTALSSRTCPQPQSRVFPQVRRLSLKPFSVAQSVSESSPTRR